MSELYERPRSGSACGSILKKTYHVSLDTQRDLLNLQKIAFSCDYSAQTSAENICFIQCLHISLDAIDTAIASQQYVLRHVFYGYDTRWSEDEQVDELMSWWQALYKLSDRMKKDVRRMRIFTRELEQILV